MELNIGRANIEIFKYYEINKYLYDLIINHEIWFSDPRNFNDPFDSNLRIKKLESLSDLELLIGNTLEDNDTKERLDKISNDPEKIKTILENFEMFDSEAIQDYGVACFSYNNDEILMWSHYSNNHKGICIKFDSKYDEDFFRLSLNVEYTKVYPEIDATQDDFWTRASKNLKYKHINWAYEEELRVIKIDGPGLKKIHLGAITEIIFGCKCSKQDQRSLMKLISRLGYSHIKLFEAKIKDREFAIEIIPLDIDYENEIGLDIKDENFEFWNKQLEVLVKDDTDDMINKVFKQSIGPLYEELLRDAIDFVGSMESNNEREEFLTNYMPKNKESILKIIRYIEKNRNK